MHGWILADSGATDAGVVLYQRALPWSPADPLLWAEYAQALARAGRFDDRLLVATRRALALAPASPAVRHGVAQMGLAYWRNGSPGLQELWRQCMRWELDHNRLSFLDRTREQGYQAAFCRHHARDLGEEAWCHGRN